MDNDRKKQPDEHAESPNETATESAFDTTEPPFAESPSGESAEQEACEAPDAGSETDEPQGNCMDDLNPDLKQSYEDLKSDMEKGNRSRELRDIFARIYKDSKCVIRDEYTAKRFFQSVLWYSKKAKLNKWLFYSFSVVTIVLPAVTTLLTAISNDFAVRCISSCLSSLTAIFTALLALFKFQHKWIQYRTTSEALQTELSRMISQTKEYSKAGLEKMFDKKFTDSEEDKAELVNLREKVFLVQIESIMAKEKTQWESLHKPSK